MFFRPNITRFLASIVVVTIVASLQHASAQFFPLQYIKNQASGYQNGWWRIAKTVSNGQNVGEIMFSNMNDSDGTYGLKVSSKLLTNKGAATGVDSITSMDDYAGQKATSMGRLAITSGFYAAATSIGAAGSSDPQTLVNFDATNQSWGLGGQFLGGPTTSTLTLDGNGKYWIGGAYGEVRGRIDGNPGTGAVAGIIGIDNADPLSTAPHYAGYFEGAINVSGTIYSSSIRWKDDVKEIPNALDAVEKLRGVTYFMKPRGKYEMGVIAEEVAAVAPLAAHFEADGRTPDGVDYARLTALLIQAVKEQQAQIVTLQTEVGRVSTELETVKATQSQQR